MLAHVGLRRSSTGTSRSSVGMTVTRFHGSFCAASLGKIAGPVFAARHRDQRRVARVDRAVDDESDVARHGIGELVQGIIFPPFRFDHVIPFWIIAALVARIRTILQPLVRFDSAQDGNEASHTRGCRAWCRSPATRSTVDCAFADNATRIDPQTHEHGRPRGH